MTILSALGLFSLLIMIFLGIIFLILLPVFAIVDIVRSRLRENDKIIWIIIIIIIPVLGSILYFVLGKDRN